MAITIKTISNSWDKACVRVHCESANFAESKEPQIAYIRLAQKQSDVTAENEIGLMLDDQKVSGDAPAVRIKQLSWTGGGPNGVDTSNATYDAEAPMILGRAWMGRCATDAEAEMSFDEHVMVMSDTANHFNFDGNFLISDVEPEKQGDDIYFECYGIIDIWLMIRKSGYVADNGNSSGGEGSEGGEGSSSDSAKGQNYFDRTYEGEGISDITRKFYDC